MNVPASGAVKKKKPWSVRFAFFAVFVAAGVFFPITMVVGICMLPTAVAFTFDRARRKRGALTVMVANLAGTFPAILDLIGKHYGFDRAIDMATDPNVILRAYIAAGIGWIAYMNLTPIFSSVLQRKAGKRAKEIEQRQGALVRKWGPDVAGNAAKLPDF